MNRKILPNINRRDFLGGVSLATAAGTFMSPLDLFAQQKMK
ncbi:MAG: twin-arginine translocation signal domain-containing protein [Emcibacteraceae bacterium]|nr:twin-arginine translocation signal domain-containing protein [Emcibacteraceae bacterium]MDG1858374.1 twin-arginine translocation signal domain-containing protein [Emcibacteraceae bacterium]